MYTPKKRWFYYIGGFFLVLAIPLTVYLVQQQQEIRQRAQQGIPPSSETESISYPWNSPRSGKRALPVVPGSTKSLLSSTPFTANDCSKKPEGDADCNNVIDVADVSYWQIDYEKKTSQYADFNGDGKVDLADYNIWRVHAKLPQVPVIQKLSQKLGLENLFAQTIWKLVPRISTVFAQESTTSPSLVTSSQVSIAADLYSIVNEYADDSYAIQTISSESTGGQLTYYTQSNDQIAQVNNFLQDTATSVMQVDGNNIAVTNNPTGTVSQTIKDGNGAFMATQIWGSQDAYTQNQAPQATTLPTNTGYATLSIQPNGAGILVERDSAGKIVSETTMNANALVNTMNYATGSETIADAKTGITLFYGATKDSQSTYMYYRARLIGVIKKYTNGRYATAFLVRGSTWQISAYEKKTLGTQKTVENILTTPDAEFPELSSLLAAVTAARQPRTIPGVFSQVYDQNPNTVGQGSAADRILAANTTQVLGAKTISTKSLTKSVLGAEAAHPSKPGDHTEGKDEQSGWTQDKYGFQDGVLQIDRSPNGQDVTQTFHTGAYGSSTGYGSGPSTQTSLAPGVDPRDSLNGLSAYQNGQAVANTIASGGNPTNQTAGAPEAAKPEEKPADKTEEQPAAKPEEKPADKTDTPADPQASPQSASQTAAAAAQAAVAATNSTRTGPESAVLSGTVAGLAARDSLEAAGVDMNSSEAKSTISNAIADAISKASGGNPSEQDIEASQATVESLANKDSPGETTDAVESAVGDFDTSENANAALASAQAAAEIAEGRAQGAEAYAESLGLDPLTDPAAVEARNAADEAIDHVEDVRQDTASARDEGGSGEGSAEGSAGPDGDGTSSSGAPGPGADDPGQGDGPSVSEASYDSGYDSSANAQGSIDSNSNNDSY